MFKRVGLFGDIPCPLRDRCDRSICLFSHDPNALFKSTVVDPVIVPAKRRADLDSPLDPQRTPSSSRHSSPPDAERPTKLQRAGSAANPLAIPTASSSPVSLTPDLGPSYSPYLFFLVAICRLVFLSLRSMLVSQRFPFRPARYVLPLVSV
jgi:RNA exonuclease 1